MARIDPVDCAVVVGLTTGGCLLGSLVGYWIHHQFGTVGWAVGLIAGGAGAGFFGYLVVGGRPPRGF